MASALRSFVDWGRDRFTPVTHTSTFRESGQITPEEFVQAGDYLVYKFPSWSWSDTATPSKRVAYLPAEKQFLVTRGVPCRRRIDDDFAGNSAVDDLVRDGFLGGPDEPGDDADDGWLRTGGTSEKEQTALREEVRTMSESGQLSKAAEEEDEIPDIDDDDDDNEAIIRDKVDPSSQATRTYTLYITYTPYYRTPRMYLSGYSSPSTPLEPMLMLDDIVGDYKEKTVTLEDFPFADGGSVKMASIHPCKHASVMKIMLDRADAALKIRLQKAKAQGAGSGQKISGMEGLIDDTSKLALQETQKRGHEAGVKAAGGDDWEVLDQAENEEDKVAIRVDQYLVVFLKFMGSLCPTIEHDFTMGV